METCFFHFVNIERSRSMAILAIQAQNQTLHVALWDGSLREKLVLPLLPDHDQTISREILPWLDRYDLSGEDLQFIVTHGLFSEAWPSGVHVLSETMLDKAVELGSLKLARSLAAHFGCLAYVVDPASPAEGHPQAFVTGTTEIPRTSRANSYIFKYLVRQEAQRQDLSLAQSRFIVAHICENNQLGALEGTTIVESLTSRDEGAFSLTQSGGLPFDSLVDLCITTADREEVLRILHGKGGFYGYLGSTNIEEVLT